MHQLYQLQTFRMIFYLTQKNKYSFSDSYFKTEIIEQSGSVSKIKSKFLINCSGLESFLLAKNMMKDNGIYRAKIFKGSYFKLSSVYRNRFKKLIYSLPSNEDSLGIHISFDEQKN